MKVLTIRQPWASLIVAGAKDIENRSWPTHYRGPLLIQASAAISTPPKDMAGALEFARRRGVPAIGHMDYGAVIGVVNVVDCVERSESQWFEGPYGFVLASARRIPPFPLKGKLGFYQAPPELVAHVERHLNFPEEKSMLFPDPAKKHAFELTGRIAVSL